MDLLKRTLSSLTVSSTPCVVSLASCTDCSHQKVPNSLLKTIDQNDKLSTTLKPYSRQFLISTGRNSSSSWPEKISTTTGLLKDIVEVFGQESLDRNVVTFIEKDEGKNDWFPSIVAARQAYESWNQYEVIVLPENKREIVTSRQQAEELFNASIDPLSLQETCGMKSLILICAHKKRDNRFF